MAAAVPLIGMAVSAIAAKKTSKPPRLSAPASQAQTGLLQSAQRLQARGSQLHGEGGRTQGLGLGEFARGGQALDQATGYYAPLLTGDRAALNAAAQPERRSILDTYRGAEGHLRGMRGGSRDLAAAEMARAKAGALSGLAPALRAGAAQAMTGIGGQRQGAGLSLFGQGTQEKGLGMDAERAAAHPYMDVAGLEQRRAEMQQGVSRDVGMGFGGMIFDLLRQQGGSKKGGARVGRAAAPSLQLAPFAPTVPRYGP